MVGALARRCGFEPRSFRVEPQPVKSLEAIAIENAVEGCVRETFGALLATYQAEAATSPIVRETFSRIAKDETRHAALAWRVADWLDARLSGEARARVEAARRAAAEEIVGSARAESRHDWFDWVGLPGSAVAGQMARQMRTALWT
jgi:hypothetical protein